MPRIKVSFVFTRGADTGVFERLAAVAKGTDGNPAFPNSPVPPAELQAEGVTFSALMVRAADGSKKVIAARRNQRELVIVKLRQVGSYVEAACNGDMATFLSSGFEPVAQRTPSQPLAQPVVEKINQGNSGELLVTVTALRGARHYELHYSAMTNGVPGASATRILTKTRPAASVSGLTPGTIYAFQVRALGSMGYTNWSDLVSRMCT